MLTYLVAFLLSAAVAFVLTPAVRWAAHRFKLVDAPKDPRKVHTSPIPRVGGIAIAVAFFVPIVGLLFWDNRISVAYLHDVNRVIGLVGGSVGIVALGLADDVFDLRARTKLLVQLIIAVSVYLLGYQIGIIANPFGAPIELGWLSLPVTVFWIVGVMNAINLIDGLDGLASGVALFSVLTLFVLAIVNGNIVVGLTAVALAGSLIGFLRYNFNPASIFMGDSGSLFLGFVLAITAISGSAKTPTVVAIVIPLLALGLPLFDTSMAIVRRFLGGKPIFSADRGHVHHRLLDLGLSHRQVVLTLYGVCLVFTVLSLALLFVGNAGSAIVLGVFLVAVMVFARVVGLLDFGNINQSVRYGLIQQRRGKAHLRVLEEAVATVRAAGSVEDVMEAVEGVGDELMLDELCLRVVLQSGRSRETYGVDWQRRTDDEDVATDAIVHIRHDLEWALSDVAIGGEIAFAFHCETDALQVPESVGYELLSLAVRDSLLLIAAKQGLSSAISDVVSVVPRLVRESG